MILPLHTDAIISVYINTLNGILIHLLWHKYALLSAFRITIHIEFELINSVNSKHLYAYLHYYGQPSYRLSQYKL